VYKNVRAGANECSHLCCESIIQSWKIHLVKTHCHKGGGIHNLKSRVPYTSLPVAISFGFVPGRGIVLGSVCILSTSDMIADSSRRFLMSLAVFRAAGGRATGSPIKGPSRKIARSGCHGGTMRSSPHCTLYAASVLARDRPFGLYRARSDLGTLYPHAWTGRRHWSDRFKKTKHPVLETLRYLTSSSC